MLEQLQTQHDPRAIFGAQLHIARLIRATLRPQDAMVRIQPQQLVILFPDSDPATSAQALARLLIALEQRPCFAKNSPSH